MIAQGAEAIITKELDVVIKDRIKKTYRHPKLDADLRKKRSRAEGRILKKLEKIIPVPKVIEINDNTIKLEFIEGKQVKEILDKDILLSKQIGKVVAKMHDQNIVHHDLTTSNMILRKDKIVLIDFGLSFHSIRYEDKAVDLHLFKQALESKHHKIYEEAMKEFLKGYNPKDKEKILKRYEEVELRGRNKSKY